MKYRLLSYRGSLSQVSSFFILLLIVFIAFTSFNKESFGSECIILTVVLFLLNMKVKNVMIMFPFLLAICSVVIVLLLSGKASERGFNAPILHALKFVSLAFVVALSNVMQNLPYKNKLTVLKTAIISIGISSVISLYNVVLVDEYAVRYAEDRGFTTVVDFNQFYSICILLSVMIFAMVSWYKYYSIKKIFIFCMLLAALVAFSLMTTGILLCVLGVAIGYVMKKYTQSKTRFILMGVVALFALAIVFIFRNAISDWIYDVTESMHWLVRGRLRSVADMVLGTQHVNEYSHNRREELMGYSMSTFREHPFFGVGYKGYGYGIIGCHQEWPDLLGVFGIVGMFIFVMLILLFSRHIMKSIRCKVDLQAFRIALVLFAVLGFLNPCISMPTLCAVFIIAPNISVIFPWWTKLQKSNNIQYGNGNRNNSCLQRKTVFDKVS